VVRSVGESQQLAQEFEKSVLFGELELVFLVESSHRAFMVLICLSEAAPLGIPLHPGAEQYYKDKRYLYFNGRRRVLCNEDSLKLWVTPPSLTVLMSDWTEGKSHLSLPPANERPGAKLSQSLGLNSNSNR